MPVYDPSKISAPVGFEYTQIPSIEEEVERLRSALDAIETMTATGDGLSPEECVMVNQIARRELSRGE